ncbi:hypothetical protein JCM8547_005334 [Rhodosporidiobolus lusitaniae]
MSSPRRRNSLSSHSPSRESAETPTTREPSLTRPNSPRPDEKQQGNDAPQHPKVAPLSNQLGLLGMDENRAPSTADQPLPARQAPQTEGEPQPHPAVSGFQASFSPTVYYPVPPQPAYPHPVAPEYNSSHPPPPQQPFYPPYPHPSAGGYPVEGNVYAQGHLQLDVRYRYEQAYYNRLADANGLQQAIQPNSTLSPSPFQPSPPPYSPLRDDYPISSRKSSTVSSVFPQPAIVPNGAVQPAAPSTTPSPAEHEKNPWPRGTLRWRLHENEYFHRTGTVKFFNVQKGFGFIIDDITEELAGSEVFVHYTGIDQSSGFRCLSPGERVEYILIKGQRKGRLQALRVAGLNGNALLGLSDPRQADAVRRNSQDSAEGANGGARTTRRKPPVSPRPLVPGQLDAVPPQQPQHDHASASRPSPPA